MSNHEITFNTKLSEAPKTRADFTYKITPTLISITDTGLGQRPVTEDIEAVLRKIEYKHQGSSARSASSPIAALPAIPLANCLEKNRWRLRTGIGIHKPLLLKHSLTP